MPATRHIFVPSQSAPPSRTATPKLRRLAVATIEWVSERVADARDDELVETRTISGEVHYVRAADLRAAFGSLRRERLVQREAVSEAR